MPSQQSSLEVYRSYCKALEAKPNSHVIKVLSGLIEQHSEAAAPAAYVGDGVMVAQQQHPVPTPFPDPLDFSPTFLGKKGHFPLLECLRVCYHNQIVSLSLSDTGMRDEACGTLCTMLSSYSGPSTPGLARTVSMAATRALPLLDFPLLQELDLRRNMLTMDSVPALKGMVKSRRRCHLRAAAPTKQSSGEQPPPLLSPGVFTLNLEGNLNIYESSVKEILRLSTVADVVGDIIAAQVAEVVAIPNSVTASSSGSVRTSPSTPKPHVVVVSTVIKKKHSAEFESSLQLTQRRLAQGVQLGRLQRRIRSSVGEGSAAGGILVASNEAATSAAAGWLSLGVYVSSLHTGFQDEMLLLRNVVFPRVNAVLKKHRVFLTLCDLHDDPLYTAARQQANLSGGGGASHLGSKSSSSFAPPPLGPPPQELAKTGSAIGKGGQGPQHGKPNPAVQDATKLRKAADTEVSGTADTAHLTALRKLMVHSCCDIFLGLYQDGEVGARCGLNEPQTVDWAARNNHVQTLQATNDQLTTGAAAATGGRRSTRLAGGGIGGLVSNQTAISNSMVPSLGYFRKIHDLPKSLECRVATPVTTASSVTECAGGASCLTRQNADPVNSTGDVVAASALVRRQDALRQRRDALKAVKEGLLESCKADYDAHFSGVSANGDLQFRLEMAGEGDQKFIKTICSDLCTVALQLNSRRSMKLDDTSGDLEHWSQRSTFVGSQASPTDHPELALYLRQLHHVHDVESLPQGLTSLEYKTVQVVQSIAAECAPPAKQSVASDHENNAMPTAEPTIDQQCQKLERTHMWQVLSGAAGSGKSYTMEKVRDVLVAKGGSRVVYHRVGGGNPTLPSVLRDLASLLQKQLSSLNSSKLSSGPTASLEEVGVFGDVFHPLRVACNRAALVHRGPRHLVFMVDDDQLLKEGGTMRTTSLSSLILQGLNGIDPLQTFVESLSSEAQQRLTLNFVFSSSDVSQKVKQHSDSATNSLLSLHHQPVWNEHEAAAFFTDHLFAAAGSVMKDRAMQAAKHLVTHKEDGTLPLYLTLAAHEMARHASENTSYSLIADDLPGQLQPMILSLLTRAVPQDLLPGFRALALAPFAPSGALLQHAVLPSSYTHNHFSCLNQTSGDLNSSFQKSSGDINDSLTTARWGRVRAVPPGAMRTLMVLYLNFQHLFAAAASSSRDRLTLPTATPVLNNSRNVNLLRTKWYFWSSSVTSCLQRTYAQEEEEGMSNSNRRSGGGGKQRKQFGISFDSDRAPNEDPLPGGGDTRRKHVPVNPWDGVIGRWSYLRENPFSLSLLPFNAAALTRPGLYACFNLLAHGCEGSLTEALQLAIVEEKSHNVQRQSSAAAVAAAAAAPASGFGCFSESGDSQTTTVVGDHFLDGANHLDKSRERFLQAQFSQADCTLAYATLLADHWTLLVKYPTALYQILPRLLSELQPGEQKVVVDRCALLQRHHADAVHNYPTSKIDRLFSFNAEDVFNWAALSLVEGGTRTATNRSSDGGGTPSPLSTVAAEPLSPTPLPVAGVVAGGEYLSWVRRHRLETLKATESQTITYLTVEPSPPSTLKHDAAALQPPSHVVDAKQHPSFGILSVLSVSSRSLQEDKAKQEEATHLLSSAGEDKVSASVSVPTRLVSVSRRTHDHAICAVAFAETKHTVRIVVSAFCDPDIVVLSLHADPAAPEQQLLSIVTRVSLPDSKIPQRPLKALSLAATLPRGYLRQDESAKNDEGMYCPSFTVSADAKTLSWPATLYGRDLHYNNVSRSKEVVLLPGLVGGAHLLGYSMAGLKVFGVNGLGDVTVWATTESPVPATVFATCTLPRCLHPTHQNPPVHAMFGDGEWVFFGTSQKGLAAWHSAGSGSSESGSEEPDSSPGLRWLVDLDSHQESDEGRHESGAQCVFSVNPSWQAKTEIEKQKNIAVEDDGKLEALLHGGASVEHLLSRFVVLEEQHRAGPGGKGPFLHSYGAWARSETKMEKIDRLLKEDKEQVGEEDEVSPSSDNSRRSAQENWPRDLCRINPKPLTVHCTQVPISSGRGGEYSLGGEGVNPPRWWLHPRLSVQVGGDQVLRVVECGDSQGAMSSAWYGVYTRNLHGKLLEERSENKNHMVGESSGTTPLPPPLFHRIDSVAVLLGSDPLSRAMVLVVDDHGAFHLLDHRPKDHCFPVPSISQY